MRQGLLSGLIEPGPGLEEDLGEGWGGKICQGARKAGKIGSGSSVVPT